MTRVFSRRAAVGAMVLLGAVGCIQEAEVAKDHDAGGGGTAGAAGAAGATAALDAGPSQGCPCADAATPPEGDGGFLVVPEAAPGEPATPVPDAEPSVPDGGWAQPVPDAEPSVPDGGWAQPVPDAEPSVPDGGWAQPVPDAEPSVPDAQ